MPSARRPHALSARGRSHRPRVHLGSGRAPDGGSVGSLGCGVGLTGGGSDGAVGSAVRRLFGRGRPAARSAPGSSAAAAAARPARGFAAGGPRSRSGSARLLAVLRRPCRPSRPTRRARRGPGARPARRARRPARPPPHAGPWTRTGRRLPALVVAHAHAACRGRDRQRGGDPAPTAETAEGRTTGARAAPPGRHPSLPNSLCPTRDTPRRPDGGHAPAARPPHADQPARQLRAQEHRSEPHQQRRRHVRHRQERPAALGQPQRLVRERRVRRQRTAQARPQQRVQPAEAAPPPAPVAPPAPGSRPR